MGFPKWDYKDPDEVLDYTIDWKTDRLDEGDTLSSSEWFIEGDDEALVKDSDQVYAVTGKTVIWLHGGTEGKAYTVTNRVTTISQRTFDQSVTLKIKTR